MDSTKQSGGSQQKGAGSQLWGTGSDIGGSGSQRRGAGSEIRRDLPPNLTPACMCFRTRVQLSSCERRLSSVDIMVCSPHEPTEHICDQPTRACCLFRAHGQPTPTGVLLSVDQSRGTVYLWHCVQVTSRRRLSEYSWRHFCLTVLTISYVDICSVET